MLECTVVTWIKTKVCYIGYCDCKYYTYGESILNWNVLLLYCWSQTNEIYGGKKLDEKPIMPTNNPCQHGLSLRGEGQGVQLPPGISKSLMKVGLLEKNTRMLKISLSILWFQGLKTWKIVYKGSFFPQISRGGPRTPAVDACLRGFLILPNEPSPTHKINRFNTPAFTLVKYKRANDYL